LPPIILGKGVSYSFTTVIKNTGISSAPGPCADTGLLRLVRRLVPAGQAHRTGERVRTLRGEADEQAGLHQHP
jgi:hypothetical protein